jgi:tryptophan 2,3-dioxygenase
LIALTELGTCWIAPVRAATLAAILITSLYLIRANRRVFDRLASLSAERRDVAQQLITARESTLRHLARRGLPVPAACVERDFTQPYVRHPDLVPVFKTIYEDPKRWWDAYDMCEKLVDIEESFQLWRFRHMKTVERIIGHKAGTGGSSGVTFLRKVLDQTFFPELIDVRTVIGETKAHERT